MQSPTYSVNVILKMIRDADWNDLEAIRVIMKSEAKLYPISQLEKITMAYKAKIREWAKADAELLKNFINR